MKATVDAKEFAQALNRVIKVIKRSPLPVLEGVLVQIKDGACTLTATDFNTWLTVEITAGMGENYLRLTDGATTIQTRIEGPFVFNMDGAVPKEFSEEFHICPKDFLRELDYLKKLAHNTDKAHIYFSGGRLSLTAAGGNYSTQVEIDGTHSIGFGFELRHMIDALRQFQGEKQVKMKVNSSVAPVVLEAEGRNDFAMVLPLRTKAAAA